MAKAYSSVAFWAQICAIRLKEGQGLPQVMRENLLGSKSTHEKVAAQLKSGVDLDLAMVYLYPHIRYEEMDFLGSLSESGKAHVGFELLHKHYLLKEQVKREILNGFVYPIYVLCIGIFLYNMQPLIYQNSAVAEVLTSMGIHLFALYLGVKGIVFLINRRYYLLGFLLRRLPLVSSLLKSMSFERFSVSLDHSLDAGHSSTEALLLATEASGFRSWKRSAQKFDFAIRRGSNFVEAFRGFTRVLPRRLKPSSALASTIELQSWARFIYSPLEAFQRSRILRIRRVVKPLALLVFTIPIFYVMSLQLDRSIKEIVERAFSSF